MGDAHTGIGGVAEGSFAGNPMLVPRVPGETTGPRMGLAAACAGAWSGSGSGSPMSERPQWVHRMTESLSSASQKGQGFTLGVSTRPRERLSALGDREGSLRYCRPMRLATVVLVLVGMLGAPQVAAAGEDEPFEASVARLDASTRELMTGSSWRPGCPVPLDRLRLVRLTYLGFDGRAHRGRLVVHRSWAAGVVQVFARLYERDFPIRRIRLVDRYGADDRASMRHDNTSAFNCRFVAGTSTWSQHAYGRAIDLNPVENPYVSDSRVAPGRGRRFLDRSDVRPGMVVRGDVAWRAFRRIGWAWGGAWRTAKDYQHFSSNGR